jgi:hypothetical protein
METTETDKPKKRASKADPGEKEKKKTKKSKNVTATEEVVKDPSTAEEKKSKKRKAEVNKMDDPEKKKKKAKDTPTTESVTITNPPATKESSQKRKREAKEEDSSEKKKKSKKESKPTIPEELEIDITAPNPPSKKALRLQKKGKPVPKLPSTSLPPTTLSTATATATADATNTDPTHPDRQKLVKEIPRAEWSVWIGNLSYKSDVKGLRGWLVRGDKRVTDKDITRMHLPLNADGQSKGYDHPFNCLFVCFVFILSLDAADSGLRMWTS